MSRPRDIDSDPDDDKERKKAKLSEEEKEEGVSKEGNVLSSSSPSDSTGTGEESMSGDTDYSSDLDHRGIFLFELVIHREEIGGGPSLFVGYDVASRYLPPLAIPGRISKARLKISDSQNHDWDTILLCSPAHHAFAIGGIWWKNFVANHNLKAMDVICFYSPFPCSNDYHYLIDYVRREELPDDLSDDNGNKILAKSTIGIFLFHLQLTPIDITCGSLIIPERKLVHFPLIDINDEPVKMKWLHFTDAQDNDSFALQFLLYNDMDGYKIIGGLDTYLNKYNLEERDMIRFYMPYEPIDENHFVIDHVKREEVADSAKEDGSGDSSSSGGDDKQGDDRGGPSQGDSSSYKGKETAVGHENPAPGQGPHTHE